MMLATSLQESSKLVKVVVFKSNLAIIQTPLHEWHGMWIGVGLRTDTKN